MLRDSSLTAALEWLLTALGFVSAWLLGRGKPSGWALSLLSQAIWVYVAIVTAQWAFVAASFVYGSLAVLGWTRWSAHGRAPAGAAPEDETGWHADPEATD